MILQTPPITLELDEISDLAKSCARKFKIPSDAIVACQLIKKSLDVRHKHPRFQVILQMHIVDDARMTQKLRDAGCIDPIPMPELPRFKRVQNQPRICIVGAGPSGLFAAMTFAAAGFSVDIFERGKMVKQRAQDIGALINGAKLNPESNICFGEGGAGTYSDGKLMTRTKSREIPIIMDWFVQFGAKECIRYEAHPHIGTDCLMPILVKMREYLEAHGTKYYFGHRIDDFLMDDDRCRGIVVNQNRLDYDIVLLCVGHSADGIFETLHRRGVQIEPKPFAVGVRVEHPQALINEIQYGTYANHPLLPAAEYAVRFNHETLPSAFSFCMCPGGRIVASQTTEDTRVVNGMSSSLRNGNYANSAIVVQATPEMFEPGPLGGLHWIRNLERKASVNCPPAFAPAQSMMDFLHHRASTQNPHTTYKPGTVPCNLHDILPPQICASLEAAFPVFNNQMRGFISSEANLVGIESRTSSPLRIVRDDQFCAIGTKGLYPLGEGAGYAGGITSCALDGMHAALHLLNQFGAVESNS